MLNLIPTVTVTMIAEPITENLRVLNIYKVASIAIIIDLAIGL
jgi:hypothetical protein